MSTDEGQAVPGGSLIPPDWFVANLNAGVRRDWAAAGPPPHRTALDPLVMLAWHTMNETKPGLITGLPAI